MLVALKTSCASEPQPFAAIPAPSTLMPVLSTSRCSGFWEPRWGRATVNAFWRLLKGAEVGRRQIQADQSEKALDEAGRLPERHAEHDLHRQAGLDRSIDVAGRLTTLAGGLSAAVHLGRPVPALVGGWCGSAHATLRPRWTGLARNVERQPPCPAPTTKVAGYGRCDRIG